MNQAITGNLSNLLAVVCSPSRLSYLKLLKRVQMKAVKKFKGLLARRRPYLLDSILGRDTRIVQPPLSMVESERKPKHHKTRSVDTHDRRRIEQTLAAEGIHREHDSELISQAPPDRADSAVVTGPLKRKTGSYDKKGDVHSSPKRESRANPEAHRSDRGPHSREVEEGKDTGKGHAHDPLEEYWFLQVGPGGKDDPPDPPAVSESPPAAEINIYETAYHEEVERIRSKQGKEATLYLTRRVDNKKEYLEDENMVGIDTDHTAAPPSGFAKLLQKAKDKGASAKEKADGHLS